MEISTYCPVSCWISIRKIFFTMGLLGPGTGSPGQWSWPQAAGVQGAFEQCSQKYSLIWGGPAWSQDSTVLAGPFQLEILYDAIMFSFSNNCRRLYFV